MGKVKNYMLLIILLIFASLTVIYLLFFSVTIKTLTFEESNTTLVNPSRGFYVQYDSADTEPSGTIKMSELRKNGITLAMIGFDIKDFTTSPISVSKIQELDFALTKARQFGLKVIFRAAYGFTSASAFKDPRDLKIIKAHIDQMAPVLNKNADVIFAVQAGFLGAWGEWHSSNLLSNDETKNTSIRNQVVSYLGEKLNTSLVINLRRPRFIRDAVAGGVDISRLGLHNDALLSTIDDMGTYDDVNFTRANELAWLKQNITSGVNGGEMPQNSEFSILENANNEFNSLHLSYLNREYNKVVLNTWKAQKIDGKSGLEYIEKQLGYRISLASVKVPERVMPNTNVNLSITLTNKGYSSPPSDFTMDIVVSIQGKVSYFEIENAKSSSILSNNFATFDTNILVPQNNLKDTIQIGLRIRPSEPTIMNDENYSIQFANKTTKYLGGINYFCEYVNKDNSLELVSY